MAEWKPLKQDFSIWKKLELEIPAVAVKYLYYKPEGVKQMEGHCALCEMFIRASKSNEAFYVTAENEDCMGKVPLGWMADAPAYANSGQIGEIFEIFEEPRANQRLYDKFYGLKPGVANYVMFSKLDDCFFEPDLIILAAEAPQAEKIMRAYSYKKGKMWEPKATPVLGCSWLYAYPYLTGNINYLFTGMHFGMKARKVMPAGRVLMSIPFDWIPEITTNLQLMPWELPAYLYETRDDWVVAEEQAYQDLAERAGGVNPFMKLDE